MTFEKDFYLAAPDESHEKAYFEMMAEWEAFGGRTNPNALRNYGMPYAAWLAHSRRSRVAATVAGNIPHLLYFLMKPGDRRIFGAAIIRHCLDDSILHIGGHVGYGIRPSERGKRYATRLLALALRKCRELGIKKAVVICGKDNVASEHVAIKNGGVAEKEAPGSEDVGYRRYWIDLSDRHSK